MIHLILVINSFKVVSGFNILVNRPGNVSVGETAWIIWQLKLDYSSAPLNEILTNGWKFLWKKDHPAIDGLNIFGQRAYLERSASRSSVTINLANNKRCNIRRFLKYCTISRSNHSKSPFYPAF